jgi:hypothetical protein
MKLTLGVMYEVNNTEYKVSLVREYSSSTPIIGTNRARKKAQHDVKFKYQNGTTIQVFYQPQNPEEYHFGTEDPSFKGLQIIGYVLGVFIIILYLVDFMNSPWKFQSTSDIIYSSFLVLSFIFFMIQVVLAKYLITNPVFFLKWARKEPVKLSEIFSRSKNFS